MKSNTNDYLMAEARKELARKGGQANLKKHGKDFYKELSKKGVAARRTKKEIDAIVKQVMKTDEIYDLLDKITIQK